MRIRSLWLTATIVLFGVGIGVAPAAAAAPSAKAATRHVRIVQAGTAVRQAGPPFHLRLARPDGVGTAPARSPRHLGVRGIRL
ncbi:MAG: hypothetical protein M3077_10400 [Candidatus Dormibacteraeota bacterium]|nr:hypothetical protein [Candidatus Dormibacteraeota bacterium]